MATRSYFISTTIPYVNGEPHLGHVLEYIQSDCFARWHRLAGEEVFYLTGSDENSLKNALAAEREGVAVPDLVARNARHFEDLAGIFTLSWDYFIRTSSDPLHLAGAVKMWQRLEAAGDLYTQRYEGLYCVGCEQFYTEDELVEGLCPERHLPPPELVEEENHFFRLSRYAQPLVEAIESGRMTILPPGRRNEVLSFLRGEVRDISVSRSQTRAHGWGIPVPGDPTQVMYVWIDALTNYINALDYAAEGALFERFWAGVGSRVHTLGKGVIRFHAVYWPAMLLSAGVALPTTLFVHEYVNSGGQKMSKSAGGWADPGELAARYGVDAVRHFLLAEMPLTQDLEYTERRLVERYNTDLANGLGNLLNRTLTMVGRYRDGVVPIPADPLGAGAADLPAVAARVGATVAAAMAAYDHRTAVASIWELVRRANGYIEESAPWKLAAAGEAAELDLVLHTVVEALRIIALQLRAFLPTTSGRILAQLAPGAADTIAAPMVWGRSLAGQRTAAPEPIFPRVLALPDA
ncbi:MAG: methionine--tRNA ligase [Candidatus Dormibacteria bacterium]